MPKSTELGAEIVGAGAASIPSELRAWGGSSVPLSSKFY
jgi:hypothetical protein